MEAAQVIPQLFGIVPTGLPVFITPTTAPSPTSYTYNIPLPPPPRKQFTHLTVFLLPGIALPPSSAAAIYLALPHAPTEFRLLGAIGENKESAVFKLSDLGSKFSGVMNSIASRSNTECVAEIDMDSTDEVVGDSSALLSTSEIVIGISVEPAEAVATQLATLRSANAVKLVTSNTTTGPMNQSLITSNTSQSDKLLLAQKIIKDAFNFLSSYSSSGTLGETVPLKIFEEWWRKFESKVKRDPSFLDKPNID